MANETTSSTLSELYTEIIAEALFVSQEQSLMRNLVKNYTISGQGKAVEVPQYAAVSASAPGEATDLSNTAINPTSATLTAAEVGIMTTLTDLGRDSAARNVAADIGQLFGSAIATKIDTDLIALFDGFSEAKGSNSTAITVALFMQSISALRVNKVPSVVDCNVVLHPNIAYDLKAALTNSFQGTGNLPDVGNEAMRNGFLGTLGGVRVYESTNFSNSGSAGDYKCGGFHPDALGLCIKSDLKIETQRDASLRGTEIVATAVYGTGELVDAYGVEMHFDSSIE